jgi:hypothetical protein
VAGNRQEERRIVDAHAHCGIEDRSFPQSFADYRSAVQGSPIEEVVMFPPVMEIYNRFDPFFEDTPQWQERRARANEYVAGLGDEGLKVTPFFFIWNDFAIEAVDERFKGIKWHRHPSEPEYRYSDPACERAVREIERRRLPVVLEEELDNTIFFIRELAPQAIVIIPHLGGLNGGYRSLVRENVFQLERIYADTALASAAEIADYVERFGHERLLFGSDFPFGDPVGELAKVQRLGFPEEVEAAILGGNVLDLVSSVRGPD